MNSRTRRFDQLNAEIFPDRRQAGEAAAAQAAAALRAAIERQGAARIIVASAPSQDELMAGLATAAGINWSRVAVFHLDEYVGLPASHPGSFRHYQQRSLLARVRPAAFHGIRGDAPDPLDECRRYAALLREGPIDLVCLGIGENGHIAFNDPPVADFSDPYLAKVVKLDAICRRQQVNDGCFPTLRDVPELAITLTCPAILSGRVIVCMVPGARKAAAVAAATQGPIATSCPASILRTHPCATLYLDNDSSAQITFP